MNVPALYPDEDTQSDALIQALRARGVNTLTTSEAGMTNRKDEDQLQLAAQQGRVLMTCNVSDFAKLHGEWMTAGRDHAGIILVQQQKWGPGDLARRVIRLFVAAPDQTMQNRMEYIGNW